MLSEAYEVMPNMAPNCELAISSAGHSRDVRSRRVTAGGWRTSRLRSHLLLRCGCHCGHLRVLPAASVDKSKVHLRLCSRYRRLCEQYLDTAESTEQSPYFKYVEFEVMFLWASSQVILAVRLSRMLLVVGGLSCRQILLRSCLTLFHI